MVVRHRHFLDKELTDIVENYVTDDHKEFTAYHPVVIIVSESEGCKAVYNCYSLLTVLERNR
jgi:hypothetical protein